MEYQRQHIIKRESSRRGFTIITVQKKMLTQSFTIPRFPKIGLTHKNSPQLMQSYPARALGKRLQVDWARDPREGPRVLMSLRLDLEPMG